MVAPMDRQIAKLAKDWSKLTKRVACHQCANEFNPNCQAGVKRSEPPFYYRVAH